MGGNRYAGATDAQLAQALVELAEPLAAQADDGAPIVYGYRCGDGTSHQLTITPTEVAQAMIEAGGRLRSERFTATLEDTQDTFRGATMQEAAEAMVRCGAAMQRCGSAMRHGHQPIGPSLDTSDPPRGERGPDYRDVAQIAVIPGEPETEAVEGSPPIMLALCEDGTLWERVYPGTRWTRITAPPSDDRGAE